MRDIVILGVAFAWLVAAFFNQFAALLFYWWLAIFRPQEFIWGDSSIRFSLMSAFILLVLSVFKGTVPRLNHRIMVLMAVLVALQAIAVLGNGCGEQGTFWLEHLGILLAVLLFTERLVATPRQLFWLITTIACSLGFYSARIGLASVLGGGTSFAGLSHMGGTFAGSNAFALGSALVIFYMIATAQNATKFRELDEASTQRNTSIWQVALRWGMWLSVVLSAYLIVALFSRGSLLGLAAGALTWFALQRRRGIWVVRIVPLVLILAIVIPIPEGYKERIGSIFEEKEELDKSAASRPYFWGIAAQMASDHKLGVGSKCFIAYYSQYDKTGGFYGSYRSVHSSHFQILAEVGYFGAFIWALLFWCAMRALLTVRKRASSEYLTPAQSHFFFTCANAMMASMLAFLVGGAFYELAHNEITWLTFTLAAVLERMSREAMPVPDKPRQYGFGQQTSDGSKFDTIARP